MKMNLNKKRAVGVDVITLCILFFIIAVISYDNRVVLFLTDTVWGKVLLVMLVIYFTCKSTLLGLFLTIVVVVYSGILLNVYNDHFYNKGTIGHREAFSSGGGAAANKKRKRKANKPDRLSTQQKLRGVSGRAVEKINYKMDINNIP
jgi:hypothetical protein